MDTITPSQRSKLMGRVRCKNTWPEITVRSILHRLGYRFRIHQKHLPGTPDIVLPKHHKTILIHGCFWHGHTCKFGAKPKSNEAYWYSKIESNQIRDMRNIKELTEAGWQVLVLWECEIRDVDEVRKRLQSFVEN